MKLYLLVFSVVFNFLSCADSKDLPTPEIVLKEATEKLNNWETLSFTATTTDANTSKTLLTTDYKLKRVGYEPHLKLFFFKEMNHSVRIYYKLASLAVVEDQKKKITTFDYDNDRSIPHYLKTYMSDDDNLLVTAKLLKEHKNDIVYVEQASLKNKKAYVYQFSNYKLWLDVTDAIPLKLEIDNGSKGKKAILYDGVVFNETMEEEVFTHEDKDGYVSTVFGIKKEPMLNIKAPEWTLLDLEGKEVTLKDLKGTPIFLEAWVSTCDHCMKSLPKVKEVENKFGDKIQVITVNFDYDLHETKATIKAKDIKYKVLQGDATFDMNYDIQSFPSFFVINSDGIITYSGRGAIENKKADDLFKALEKVE